MRNVVPLPAACMGMTLAEFAAAMETHPQAVRPIYRRMMRAGEGVELPEVIRRVDDGGTVKFWLPAGEYLPGQRLSDTQASASLGTLSVVPTQAAGTKLESESVIIPMTSYRTTNWFTLCVSSQVGCRMGCTFCETGRMGLLRNLTAAEIVRQRLVARTMRMAAATTAPATAVHGHTLGSQKYFADGIQNIVFMGMGEPLDNFDEVTQAIRVLSEPAGMDFPMTQITVSTVGRIDGLRKLGALNWPNLRIAISLNAANDRLRDELMPINKGMPLADLQRALLEYPMARKGRYLIEYVLIKGVNDSPADADAVAEWCRPLRCIVNIIPYNPQRYAAYETPPEETIAAFLFRLKGQGIFTKRRTTHGRDLMGACGQLGNPEVSRKRSAAN